MVDRISQVTSSIIVMLFDTHMVFNVKNKVCS